jgi:OmpR-family two-component system manganese-sensing response regulator
MSCDFDKTRIRILYVENDEDSCVMMRALLGPEGCEVVTVQTVADGLRLARLGGFALYMLENWFPDGTGTDLCQQIRTFDSSTPILFYSSLAYEADIERGMSAGAQGYLVKPNGLEDLGEAIIRLISSQITMTVASAA